MRKKEFLGIYVSMLLFLIAHTSAKKSPKWCWTKPVYETKFVPK